MEVVCSFVHDSFHLLSVFSRTLFFHDNGLGDCFLQVLSWLLVGVQLLFIKPRKSSSVEQSELSLKNEVECVAFQLRLVDDYLPSPLTLSDS